MIFSKKNVLVLLAVICCISFSFAQQKKEKAKKNETRTEFVTKFDNKKKKEITHKESVAHYNENGEIAEEWGYDKSGEENKHIKYFYEGKKKTKEIHYDSKGFEKKRIEYKYDEKGRKIEERHIDADNPKEPTIHRFEYADKK
jgi:hypothetical protein